MCGVFPSLHKEFAYVVDQKVGGVRPRPENLGIHIPKAIVLYFLIKGRKFDESRKHYLSPGLKG